MSHRLTATALSAEQIAQAFPLVQAFLPTISVEEWRCYASTLLGWSGSGIMTVQHRGYIHGLFCWQITAEAQLHQQLEVKNFIALDLFDPARVVTTLLAAMDDLATSFNCDVIQTTLQSSPPFTTPYQRWLLGLFRAQGHVVEHHRIFKSTDPQVSLMTAAFASTTALDHPKVPSFG